MSKKIRRARKPKYGEPLVPYSIMLRRDQREYLGERENASDWVREAIDMRIESESGEVTAVDVVAISKRITFLEQRIEALKKTPEYERAKSIIKRFTPERFKKMREQLSKDEEIMSTHYDHPLIYWEGGALFEENVAPIPGWTWETLSQFMSEHKIRRGATFPPEYVLIFIDKMERALPYEARLIEGYEKRTAELQSEIEKLKNKITK